MHSAPFVITNDPLELEQAIRAVASIESGPAPSAIGVGAITTFLGLVRRNNAGRRVSRLEYEAYAPLALGTFRRIGAEIGERWPTVRLAIHHRTGRLAVGEASVAIVAASAHRGDCFAACRYAIERIKQIAPIWKHEFFEDGDVWIEGATADPEDAGAQAEAYRRACG